MGHVFEEGTCGYYLIRTLTFSFDTSIFINQHIYSAKETQAIISPGAFDFQVFTNNKDLCLKVTTKHMEKMVELAMNHNKSGVEFLELLKAVVKVEEIDLPVKRNQLSVMKHLTSFTGKLDMFMNISISSR